MRRPGLVALSLSLALAAPAGCGVGDTPPGRAGPPASGLPRPAGRTTDVVHVYFASPLGLERVSRLYSGPDAPRAALDRLTAGPDRAERARGLVTFVPPDVPPPTAVTGAGATVDVYLPPRWPADGTALRQLVCTVANSAAGTERGAGRRTRDVRVRLHRAGRPAAEERCTAG
ncbi:GerMN domain-containing protein [Streptomyces sp. URMC 126]|uniref:GerMN domain-containing protein n=1 Tax=Streptomyces sp. URMC 126 TaxID=3423401 RepID=UPI003F1BD005